jgi:GNAT superfamily N-acetyltransferase
MFRLRAAVWDDLPALASLIDDSVRGLSERFYTAMQVESALRHVLGVDSQLVADGTYFVIECDEVIVAAGGWSGRRTLYGGDQSKAGVEDEPMDPATTPARLRAFFVHPLWSRRGLGRRLYEACEEAAALAGYRSFELVATLPGVPLYEALGFATHERYSLQMPDGEELEVVHMTKEIAAEE